jgi:hypothetical protein
LSVACFMSCLPLHVVCFLLRICQCSREGCLLRHCCPLDRVCCTLSVAYRTLVMLHVGRCASSRPTSPVACCLSSVACSHPARRHVAWCIPHVPCLWSVACSHPAHRHIARCMTHVPSRMLSLVRRLSHLVCHLLHNVVAEWHSATHAAHRGGASPLSASVAKVCVRACVPACVRAGSKRDGVTLRVAVRAWGCAACATALRVTGAMCAGMSCVRAFG